ncbi:bacterio-opsin activator domain-containing protein [Halostagnicola kamekurae]|uniref:PAS domain S-box-containing protein n=1 Tax=Halostagnicola kamekurae TaxID=619731 RepID=A0A1I6RT08_9EURY|nr:bacterio-opsin activator domain-containing protein [Halostagnicola kamekurae]SFS67598.1 PAS domain S-box-containing protein [Halostagnicola kamekurae]
MGTIDTELSDGDADSASNAPAALEHVVDPVVLITDGAITYANAAAREAFALTDADGGKDTFEANWDRLGDAIGETTVGTVRTVELEHGRYDARVHRGVDGTTIVFTERNGTNDPAGDRAVKARAVNEAPVGVTISDPSRADNPLVYVNDTYQELTGYAFEDIVGQNCRFLQGPDSSPEAVAEMRAAIDEERPVTVELRNYREDGTEFWNEVTIAPVYDDRGELANYVGFQNDVTARKEAELEAERRTEELEYTLARVEGLIQDVTDAVVGSKTRSELEAAVCDRIVEESDYESAWIGERNPATREIDVRTAAGDAFDELSPDDDHPAAETLETTAVATGTVDESAVAAFPLFYNDIEYGVLTVLSDADRAFDERETVILSALARAAASGINARETSRMLATDAVVAVDVEIADDAAAPIAVAQAANCRLEYRRSVHRTGAETASLFTATDASADDSTEFAATLADSAAPVDGVDLEVLVERDGDCLVELTTETNVVAWLSDRGVRTQAITAEDGRARLTLEIPRSADVRSIIEAIEARYDGTDIRSFHHREPDTETRAEFVGRLEEELTERQFAALQRAYLGGYFEWPRPATGEELAESMGVSRPTFHEHLRNAEAKLCRAFFGDD